MKRVDLRELDTLLSDDRIVFIACLAHWSPESRMVEPVFDELACEFAADVTVVAVDTDAPQFVAFAKRWHVTWVPSAVLINPYDDEQPTRTWDGAQPKTELRHGLDSACAMKDRRASVT
ncbi:MAG: thioredoxin domain-containing protein [Actinomyces sp.]|nr:thioredoxin domain-containing protein [Actinomyces sp.]MDU1521748.1 thioredoxin domain-containing protein [Actinomyces sp.]MDU2983677.1 thioredoxin domain-containing protein [Actinomyces sp.]